MHARHPRSLPLPLLRQYTRPLPRQVPKNTLRYCLDDCPQVGVQPNCYKNCTVGYYPNYPSSSRLGAFCLPSDTSAKQQLFSNSKLYTRWDSLKSMDYLLAGVGISIGIALIWMLLVCFLPKIMVYVAFVLAIILLLITAIVFFTASKGPLSDSTGWDIFLGIICIIVLLILLFYLVVHRNRLAVCGAFLENASLFLRENCLVFLYIPIFIVLTFLFGILIVFQYLAYSSSGNVNFSPDSIYYTSTKSFILTALLVI